MDRIGTATAIALLALGLAACGGTATDEFTATAADAPAAPAARAPAATTQSPGTTLGPQRSMPAPTTPPTTVRTVQATTTTSTPEPAITATIPDSLTDAPRFLALGDSYTIGESVDYEERWPVQLVELLRGAGLAVAAPEFVAETGWTTSRLARAVDEAMPDGPYGIVSLQIGVNNQFQGGDLEVFRSEFRDLLERAITLGGGRSERVLVLSIPDYSVTPFAENLPRSRISYEIGLFNDVLREEAAAVGARFVDVTPSSEAAADDETLLAFDGLHPSGVMYAEWAELALPEATAALLTAEQLTETK